MARTGENIYKRKDGRWEGRYIYAYDENGKAKYKYIYAKSYREVKSKMFNVHASSSTNITISMDDKKSKYEYWLYNWLNCKNKKVKESTYIRYKNSIENHILPYLGKYPIDKISTNLMEQYVSELFKHGNLNDNSGLSVKSVSDILTIIKETFKHANLSGVATICNFESITLRKNPNEMRVLSISEVNRLLNVITANMDLYKLGIVICLFTGVRIGEICALKWKNISLEDRTIKIESTMQRLQNLNRENCINKTRVIITEPKSFSSKRIIPIPSYLLEILVRYQASPNAYLLSGKSECYVEPRIMQYRFKTYLDEGQIDNANFHALRHTFATRCVEVGVDVKTLSEILGHSSVKITLDKYVHSSLELKRKQMEKMQILFD